MEPVKAQLGHLIRTKANQSFATWGELGFSKTETVMY